MDGGAFVGREPAWRNAGRGFITPGAIDYPPRPVQNECLPTRVDEDSDFQAV